MADLALEWNDDFQLSPTGGLLLADGDTLARQRICRRIFTAVRGYIFHPSYGAGLPQRIGTTMSVPQIRAAVVSQIGRESSVSHSPQPVVTVEQNRAQVGLFIITVEYTSVLTGRTVSFTLTV